MEGRKTHTVKANLPLRRLHGESHAQHSHSSRRCDLRTVQFVPSDCPSPTLCPPSCLCEIDKALEAKHVGKSKHFSFTSNLGSQKPAGRCNFLGLEAAKIGSRNAEAQWGLRYLDAACAPLVYPRRGLRAQRRLPPETPPFEACKSRLQKRVKYFFE